MRDKRSKDRKSKRREQVKETLPEASVREEEATTAAPSEEQPRDPA
jgi:hypothetical protein